MIAKPDKNEGCLIKLVNNALTIDLEDWYQGLSSTSLQHNYWSRYEDRVVESTDKLLNILAEYNVKATFFTLGYVADHFPALVKRVADDNHEIALHGYFHQKVFQLSPDEFREDVLRGKTTVEGASGKQVYGYRAPMFSINRSSLWALEILRDLGFLYDSSIFPTRNMLYGFPGAPRKPYRPFEESEFIEFPMSTVRLFGMNLPISGGFYTRALPYSIVNQGVNKLNQQGLPLIYYLHPWELDPDHPRPELSLRTLRERFTHYWGLRTTERKLRALLRDFNFNPMIDLYRSII